jgi:hypothetical protein
VPPIAPSDAADRMKLTAFIDTVDAAPRTATAAPPIGGPTMVAVHAVDSKRALTASKCSCGTEAFRYAAVNAPQRQLVDGLCSERVFDEPIQLLVNPRHPLADRDRVSPIDIGGQRIWIPGLVEGTEWADFYTQFAATFRVNIDAVGPNFGTEHLRRDCRFPVDCDTGRDAHPFGLAGTRTR